MVLLQSSLLLTIKKPSRHSWSHTVIPAECVERLPNLIYQQSAYCMESTFARYFILLMVETTCSICLYDSTTLTRYKAPVVSVFEILRILKVFSQILGTSYLLEQVLILIKHV